MENGKLYALEIEKEDLQEYCETKMKYFLDLVQRLIGMKSILGRLNWQKMTCRSTFRKLWRGGRSC